MAELLTDADADALLRDQWLRPDPVQPHTYFPDRSQGIEKSPNCLLCGLHEGDPSHHSSFVGSEK